MFERVGLLRFTPYLSHLGEKVRGLKTWEAPMFKKELYASDNLLYAQKEMGTYL